MPTSVPFAPRALRGVRTVDGDLVDLRLGDGSVLEVLPGGALDELAQGDCLDLPGHVVMTAPAEPHAHLDKALTFDAIRPPVGDLDAAIEAWHGHCAVMTVDGIAERARTTVRRMLASGITAIRSHVDVLPGPEPARGAQALARVRAEFSGVVDIQLVALSGWNSDDAAVEAVLDVGMDLMGGACHLAPDPSADLRRVLATADRHDLPIDLHTDENLWGDATLGDLARAVRGRAKPVSAGHCVRLGTLAPAELAEIIDEVLASDIGIISLPITNLYLQGWQDPVATPRGLTALRALLDAGVRLAAGADNVRDPFNPVGRCDPMETASLLVSAGHLDLRTAVHLVTGGARDVMGLPAAGPVAGARADLLAIRAAGLGEAIAFASSERAVLSAGRLVSRTTVTTTQVEIAGQSAPLGASAQALVGAARQNGKVRP